VSLFARGKRTAVRSFILKLINNNCPGLKAVHGCRRLDSRVNLTVVLTVIPIEDGQLQVHKAFAAVTKEFSNTGLAIVLDGPRPLHQAVLGLWFEGTATFLLATAKHLDPMGGGFFQLGFQLTEMVSPADYPELESVHP
jgi:hypothetical protein